jgi:hypothetical protein
LDSLLVDAANTVVDEVRRKQHGHEKDLSVSLFSFLKRPQPFGVHHHVLDGGVIRILYEFRPNPKSLGTSINGGSNLESRVLVEQHPIKYIALSSSILANHRDDPYVFILVGFHQPVDCFLVDYDF